MEQTQLTNLINILGKFKDLKRTGWINRQVSNPESDAEHSFSLSLMTMFLAPDTLNKLKCLELALTHDLSEIYAGDITPTDNISPLQKLENEQKALKQIAQELNWPQLLDLFEEYNQKETKESIFVNALDKLDTIITAQYYDNNNRSPKQLLPEFSNYARRCLNNMDGEYLNEIKNIFNRLNTSERK